MEAFKYLRDLFMSEERIEREIDRHWSSVSSDADAEAVCCCEETAVLEGNAVDLLINLRPNPNLWSLALGSDQKNEVLNTSSRNELPSKGDWAQP